MLGLLRPSGVREPSCGHSFAQLSRESVQTQRRCKDYRGPMLRDGPIPRFVHGILEYALGVLFIAAPFVFDFNSGAATGMSVAVGVLVLILAAVSDGPVSLVNQLPLLLHVALLYVLSIFLVAAPFLLGFSDEVAPRNFFMISGVLLLLITIGTRFRRTEPDDKRGLSAASKGSSGGRASSGGAAEPAAAPTSQSPQSEQLQSGSQPTADDGLPPVPVYRRPTSSTPPGSV